MVTIHNNSLKNKTLTTDNGEYWFDANGNASVPEDLAKRLILINGFSIVDGTVENQDVTLEGGIVWHPISGGYIVSSSAITYTITGSAFDGEPVPPSNATLDNDNLMFADTIDINNIHVRGVISGDTIQIGDSVYKWTNLDGNTANGLELDSVGITMPGGTYTTLEGGGYELQSSTGTDITISGVDISQVTLDGDTLLFNDNVNPSNIHISGVEENSTVNIGNTDYVYRNTDNDTTNLELVEIHSIDGSNNTYIEIDNQYELTDGNTTITLSSQLENIEIVNGEVSISPNADIDNIHISGVEENSTVNIGGVSYKWVNADGNIDNGLELVEVNPHIPLDNGGTYTTIEGGYVLTDDTATFTVLSSQSDDIQYYGVQDGNLIISEGIDTNNVHVLGVNENDSIQIGSDIYRWENNNNGYELVYVPLTGWETIKGGFVYDLNGDTYTLIGSAFGTDTVPSNVNVVNGELVFSNGIDTNNVHVLGVTENDTINIGNSTYRWENTDENDSNGYELVYVPPVYTLPSGDTYSPIENGFILTNGNSQFTLIGDTVDSHIYIDESGSIAFTEGVYTDNIHAIGVNEGDTLLIGDTKYIWKDTDENDSNGLELALENPPISLSNGGTYTTVEGGYALTDGNATVTVVSSDDSILANLGMSNGTLTIDDSVDIENLHVLGVNEGDIVVIGGVSYKWAEEDENPADGLELAEKNPHIPLDNGGTYTTIEGGYVLTDDTATFTVLSSQSDDIQYYGVQDGNLIISEGIDTNNVHVLGVNENSTINIGNTNYIWENNNDINGFELNEIHTLPTGDTYTTIEGGYILTNGEASYTILSSNSDNLDNGYIYIDSEDNLAYSTDIDTSTVHILGVNENDSVTIGNCVYTYLEYDLVEGFELVLTQKDGWSSISSGYIYDSPNAKYTISGAAFKSDDIVPNNITITSGNISLDPTINTSHVHILGVEPHSTISIGDTNYLWVESDNNEFNGFELNEIHTLPTGDTYTTIEGGYILTNGEASYTLMGDNVDLDNIYFNEENKLAYMPDINTSSIHVLGVRENEPVYIMGDKYEYRNIDGLSDNGYELVLVSKDGWERADNGYAYHDDECDFTITGSAFESGSIIPNNVVVIGNALEFPNKIDTSDVHAIGVTPNSTVNIDGTDYFWSNSDWNTNNGYELVEIHTLPSGDTFTNVNNKVIISNGTVNYTLIGSVIDEDHTFINSDNKLSFSDGINIDTIHAIGVTPSDTLRVGDTIYIWEDIDNLNNGLELRVISKAGWTTIDGGYIYSGNKNYTLTGSAFSSEDVTPSNVTVANDNLILDDNIDTSNVHIVGIDPNTSVQIGDNFYWWRDTDNSDNGVELQQFATLPNGGTYFSTEEGFILTDGTAEYTVLGDTLDTDHVGIVGGAIILKEGLDVDNFYVYGVRSGETILIGDSTYKWEDDPDNPGYKPIDTNPPITLTSGGTYTTIESGYVLTDGIGLYTLVSDTIDDNNIGVKDGKLIIGESTDPDTIHVLGVAPNDTIYIGEEGFRWEDKDNIVSNGYELVMLNPPVDLKYGGTYTTIKGGFVLTDGTTNFTLLTDTSNPDIITHFGVQNGDIIISEGIDTDSIHVLGVKEDDSIQIGDDIFFWEETDGTLDTGFELVKAKDVDGFIVDWDGKSVTVEGGMKTNLSDEDIAIGTKLDDNRLSLDGIIDNPNEVHISGMDSLSVVTTNDGEYTLMDTDNNLDNGLELVGGMDDTEEWRYSNRSRPVEPQIWRHYFNSITDIKVIGVTCRPSYVKRILTLTGNEISEITNNTNYVLTIAGSVTGIMSPNSLFKNSTITSNSNTDYILQHGTLYVKNGSITGIKGDFTFTLDSGYLTVNSGVLDVESATIEGTSISKVNYLNKEFIVVKGKLARNAIKRTPVKKKP